MKQTELIKTGILLWVALIGWVRPLFPAEASSAFDTGLDGWSPVIFGFSWQPSGGNPGGFVQFSECCNPPFNSLVAPGNYLGDWSSLEGTGAFRYDFRLFAGTTDPNTAGVLVSGPGGSMFWHQPPNTGINGWETLVAPLTQSSWEIASGNWGSILANVSEVRLIPDYLDGFGEITGIDNVALVPEPSPLTLAGVALLALAAFRWCCRIKKNDKSAA
jgi:hypothetical protein